MATEQAWPLAPHPRPLGWVGSLRLGVGGSPRGKQLEVGQWGLEPENHKARTLAIAYPVSEEEK